MWWHLQLQMVHPKFVPKSGQTVFFLSPLAQLIIHLIFEFRPWLYLRHCAVYNDYKPQQIMYALHNPDQRYIRLKSYIFDAVSVILPAHHQHHGAYHPP